MILLKFIIMMQKKCGHKRIKKNRKTHGAGNLKLWNVGVAYVI